MGTIGAAVIKLHKEAMDKRPEWFWHLFAKCEAKAARVAEQATHGPHACGDATFIEVYAKTLRSVRQDPAGTGDEGAKYTHKRALASATVTHPRATRWREPGR